MAWAKFDDGFYDHPKVLGLDRKLELQCDGLHLKAVCWCSRHLTDGLVPKNIIPLLNGTTKLAQELVRVGIWEEAGDGYIIHDYLDYNPSKEKVLLERKAAVERMNKSRKFGRSSGEQDAKFGLGSPSPSPSPPDVLIEHKKSARGAPVDNSKRKRGKSTPEAIGDVLQRLAAMGVVEGEQT